VSGGRFVVQIRFSDLNNFPPNLFEARCYLPFVHRLSERASQMHGQVLLLRFRVPQSLHFATAGLPHGIPTSLSLDTYSIWQYRVVPIVRFSAHLKVCKRD
jgi:hypothetical protein